MISHNCYCDHTDTMHRWDNKLKKYVDCLYLYHDGPCTCSRFKPKSKEPARFDLNGLILK